MLLFNQNSLTNIKELTVPLQESLVRQFLASNLIQKNNRFVWKVYLDSIINNFSDICGFPEFTNVQYNGPTLFVGGSESKYIRYVNELNPALTAIRLYSVLGPTNPVF